MSKNNKKKQTNSQSGRKSKPTQEVVINLPLPLSLPPLLPVTTNHEAAQAPVVVPVADRLARGQIWRNRGGELVLVESAAAADGERFYCRFLQPRHAPLPGYLIDGEGRFFSRSFVPAQGDNPFDLQTLVERSLSEKEEALNKGPTLGMVNDEDPFRILELFNLVAAVIKKRGKSDGPKNRQQQVEAGTGALSSLKSTTCTWIFDEVQYEEKSYPLVSRQKGAVPQTMVVRSLTVSKGSRDWWSVEVFDAEKPYISFFNRTVGDFFMLAGMLLPRDTLFGVKKAGRKSTGE